MADIFHGRASMQFSNQGNPRMPGIFLENGNTLHPPMPDGGDILRLWDMDPETSIVRGLIRSNILKYLSKQSKFREYGEDIKQKLARVLDENLFTKAEAQVHYMNLSTLESRLDDLIHDYGNAGDVACHVSSSSNGSTTWSSEKPHNMEASSPASLCDASTSVSDGDQNAFKTVQSSLSNTNSYTSSMLGDGLLASQRYLPNEHHRIMANTSIGSGGSFILCPEDISGPNSRKPVPVVSRHNIEGRYPSNVTVLSPDQYSGSCNNDDFNGTGGQMPSYRISKELLSARLLCKMNTVQTIDGDEAPEGFLESHRNSAMHLMTDCESSGSVITNMSALSFGSSRSDLLCSESNLIMNSANYPHLDLQTVQKSRPQSANFAETPYVTSQTYCSEGEHSFVDRHLNKNFQLSSQRPSASYKLSENMISSLPLSESVINCRVQTKGCIIPGQVLPELLTVQDATEQQPPQNLIEDSRKIHSLGKVAVCQSGTTRGLVQYQREHRILFLYEHVMNCSRQDNGCEYPHCRSLKQNIKHISHCDDIHCRMSCFKFNRLFEHYRECVESSCGICCPVRVGLTKLPEGVPSDVSTNSETAVPTNHEPESKQSPLKRLKIEHPSQSYTSQCETSQVLLPVTDSAHLSPQGVLQVCQEVSTSMSTQTVDRDLISKPSASSSSLENCAKLWETEFEDSDVSNKVQPNLEPVNSKQLVAQCKEENMQVQTDAGKIEMDTKCTPSALSDFDAVGTELEKPKIKVVSLLDTFPLEKVREHISSLRQGVSRSKAQEMESLIDKNSCSLCGMEKLLFEPPPRYCASCSKQISPKGVYYSMKSINNITCGNDARASFCSKCYNMSGESIKAGGEDVMKANLERRWNYAETDAETEWWVECDKCKAWQHQICALFNGKRKEAWQAEYTCPDCCLRELESGEHKPFPQTQKMVLGAKDLPTNILSDHLEQWLFLRLEQERRERANSLGKNTDEVPGVEGLTVRVVSSVDKKLEVKPLFHEVFKEEDYPSEFPYRSKAVLLFQNIEGADVCLFGMYVQEYGSGCASPNQRRVCLSYIDSVKYFRPEIKAATGEALRTFVYHELLIGYLDYCKKRGFTSCYIWACPSQKRDDYILYCHPTAQKMPKSDKLREWYQTMIRKARKEGIVAEHTNLYDNFFVPTSECKAKITAARLPYFDSDYWPGEAEILLQKEDESVSQKKGTKAVIERALRAARRDALIGNPKDILLMHQLGEIMRPMKEDFIIVYLRHSCKHCCQPFVSGKQWSCSVCKNFQLCAECYSREESLQKKDRHPVTTREKHSFQMVEVENVLPETDDKDGVIQSEFFDTRTVFLGLCQSNQYQFDTLRRAKHSTMMILYHLHNPTAPAFISSCVICHGDIDRAKGWQCMTCPDYELCDPCYKREGASHHDHELVSHASMADHYKGTNEKPVLQQVLDLLVHATKCLSPRCTYPYCHKMKRLFHHGSGCKTRATRGCKTCQKIWYLLQLHARVCKENRCCVPRCKDLKDHMRKKQQQCDSRRRASAYARIRQQDSEASECSG